jgi:orc1/cdc6 family replication initiation protein
MVNEIIADPDVLEEEYIPESIPCREVQKRELAFCLSPIERGMKPLDCLCHGKPGTGKTALVKYILQQIQDDVNAFALYVNCWENKTLSSILDRIVEQLGLVIVEKSYSVKLPRIKCKIEDKPCVITLDEVDKLDCKELNDVIYMLKGLGKVGLICISNKREYFLVLDPRITSRLRFRSIDFPPYSNAELLTILKHRIIDCRALYPDTWSNEILEEIADLAAGDARIAIQTLRNSALIAEKSNKPKITIEDVEKAYEEVKEIKRKYLLEKLGEHHKIICRIVRENPGITSSNFYEAYKREAKEHSLNPKSGRTFNNYVDELISLGYLRVERAKVRGNVRSFSDPILSKLKPYSLEYTPSKER